MATCGIEGCDRTSRWVVGFMLRALPDRPAAECVTTLQVCDRHRDVSIPSVMAVMDWEDLTRQFLVAGYACPDPSLTELYLLPLA